MPRKPKKKPAPKKRKPAEKPARVCIGRHWVGMASPPGLNGVATVPTYRACLATLTPSQLLMCDPCRERLQRESHLYRGRKPARAEQ
jgi:hypothetical protein